MADAPPVGSMRDELPTAAVRAIRRWAACWSDPALTDAIDVTFSRRLRRTLGRATPESGRIVLHAALRDGPAQPLLSVLCHEVAHVAAYRLAARDGRARPRPHGPEWSSLVRSAGFAPVTRDCLGSNPHPDLQTRRPTPAGRRTVVHLCPVCQTRRLARCSVPRWRCAQCVAAGLDGYLVVLRVGEQS
jgi:predicted SprT family Zn-dependent metalloprotease